MTYPDDSIALHTFQKGKDPSSMASNYKSKNLEAHQRPIEILNLFCVEMEGQYLKLRQVKANLKMLIGSKLKAKVYLT